MAIENPFSKLSKPQLYAVVAGGVAVSGYALYRHHASTGSWSPLSSGTASSAASASSGTSPTGTVTDPSTGQVYSDTAVDPVTQMTYASEIANYGTVAAADSEYAGTYGTSSNSVSAGEYDTGYVSATTTQGTTTTSGTDQYTSNSAWSQAVQAGLEDISGSTSYDGTDIGTALGAYLQGQPLTAAQNALINTAIAEYGKPPTGAPPVTLVPVTTPTTTTTGNITGVPRTSPSPINLSFTNKELEVSFPKVGGATKYQYKFSNGHTATTTTPEGVFSSATVGTKGTVAVQAGNANGWGPYSAAKSFTFPK